MPRLEGPCLCRHLLAPGRWPPRSAPAHPRPAAAGAARAGPGVTQQHRPRCAWWDEETERSWFGIWQGSSWIGEEGGREGDTQDEAALPCLLSWPCRVVQAPCHRAPRPPSTPGDAGIAQAGPPEHVSAGAKARKSACACAALAACPRGRATAPGARRRAPWVQSACASLHARLPGRPPGSGWAAAWRGGGGCVCAERGVPACARQRGGPGGGCRARRAGSSRCPRPALPGSALTSPGGAARAAVGAVMRWSSRRTAR